VKTQGSPTRAQRAFAADPARTIAPAAEWRLISLLFERPRAGWHAEVAALAREVHDPELGAAAEAARTAGEGEFLSVLGPGGRVSPREVAYRSFEDPGQILAALSAVYGAFAYQPRAEDPLDHVAVEAGFVGYLLLKEAFAAAGGQRKAAAMAAVTRSDFLQTHLAPLAAPLAERLQAAGPAYLAAVARVLAARLPAPAPVVTDTAQPDDNPACGACAKI